MHHGRLYALHLQLRSLYGMAKGVAATVTLAKPDGDVVQLQEVLDRLPTMLKSFHSDELWTADITAKVRRKRLGL